MKPLFFLLLPLLLTACLEDDCQETVTFRAFDPITITANEWRSDVFTPTAAETVCDPSGFYVYGDYLFVLDRNEGLHLIDNRDNANPRPVAFVPIRGGQGIAVRNNVLYVNQYIDLLAFDISSPESPRFLSRTEDAFNPYTVFSSGMVDTDHYIIGYTARTETYEANCRSPYHDRNWFLEDGVYFALSNTQVDRSTASAGTGQPETVGQGGSLARFTIAKGMLYAVDESSLRTFSLANPTVPEFIGISNLDYGIETIFPQGDHLYIGANNGLHIYSVETPTEPEYLSTFAHVRSCDPVVVQGDLAYVTMWGGSNCGNQGDQLMVVDVSDPRKPTLVQETPMENSHGLGIDGNRLFLAAGDKGVRVYSLLDDGRLGPLLHQATGFNAKDVIVLPSQQRLIAFGWEQAGIEQYDYTEDGAPTAVSHFSVCN